MRAEHVPTREEVLHLVETMNATQLSLWYDIGKRIHEVPISDSQIEDPTFADVMDIEEMVMLDRDDIVSAKAALAEEGERISLQALAIELGIPE